jgi:hypothetical protein
MTDPNIILTVSTTASSSSSTGMSGSLSNAVHGCEIPNRSTSPTCSTENRRLQPATHGADAEAAVAEVAQA